MSHKPAANKTKESETFPFASWTVEVHRRAFRRSVSIYLYPQKPIKVVASKMTSQKAIQDFLLSKKDWIEKNLNKFSELANQFPAKKIRSDESFPFLGQSLPLRMTVTVLKKTFVAIQEGELRLHIPRDQWSSEILTDEHPQFLAHIRAYYKREAIRRITDRTEYWAQQMKLYPTSLKFREQRTRWGSCSSRGNVNFNWRLIVFKPEVIDYVIVHELAHLKHMNHSDNFWSLVEHHLPEYQNRMKELREQQRFGDFLNFTPS